MVEADFTTVRIRKEDLKALKAYCAIFRWKPSQLLSELAESIRKTVPDLFDKTEQELRDEGKLFHVKVRLD